jgi:hypothetical protein
LRRLDDLGWKDTYRVGRVRGRRARRPRVQVGAPDESLTRFSGLAAVTELIDRLGVIDRLDATVGPIKVRDRGFTAGQVLVGMAAAQLCRNWTDRALIAALTRLLRARRRLGLLVTPAGAGRGQLEGLDSERLGTDERCLGAHGANDLQLARFHPSRPGPVGLAAAR